MKEKQEAEKVKRLTKEIEGLKKKEEEEHKVIVLLKLLACFYNSNIFVLPMLLKLAPFLDAEEFGS